ncbi:TIGR02611 family protein [Rhodococcus sp. HNM0569]|uniref:TIGR02611 family protein n=1 Tax=Rhodococcus sp. HNM0569 TaxID=2716340 RepID=UPI00146B060C|nr:TIGR02611 family protein [Rhodococcus sp. HNM0569]NLU81314.1 TIGR02611 family protein [Rhodococcus sp. HNM0569]
MSGGETDTAHTPDDDTDTPSPSKVRRAAQAWMRKRESLAAHRSLDLSYRIVIGVLGSAVLALGIVAIPYPGPGWLIVFAGLGILASEFGWAHRLLGFVRGRYDRFMGWFAQQSFMVRGAGALATGAVVVLTLWVLGTFGLVGSWVGVDYTWLDSPL